MGWLVAVALSVIVVALVLIAVVSIKLHNLQQSVRGQLVGDNLGKFADQIVPILTSFSNDENKLAALQAILSSEGLGQRALLSHVAKYSAAGTKLALLTRVRRITGTAVTPLSLFALALHMWPQTTYVVSSYDAPPFGEWSDAAHWMFPPGDALELDSTVIDASASIDAARAVDARASADARTSVDAQKPVDAQVTIDATGLTSHSGEWVWQGDTVPVSFGGTPSCEYAAKFENMTISILFAEDHVSSTQILGDMIESNHDCTLGVIPKNTHHFECVEPANWKVDEVSLLCKGVDGNQPRTSATFVGKFVDNKLHGTIDLRRDDGLEQKWEWDIKQQVTLARRPK